MKRTTVVIFCVLCLLAGAARFADLMLFTEADTGFVAAGSVWLRYGLVLALVALFFAVAALQAKAPQTEFLRVCKKTQQAAERYTESTPRQSLCVMLQCLSLPPRWLTGFAAMAAAVAGLAAVRYSVAEFANPTTSFGAYQGGSALMLLAFCMRLVLGATLLAQAGWFALLTGRTQPLQPETSTQRTVGLTGCVALVILPVLRYAEHPSSVHRILLILPVLSALAGLVFYLRFAGALCTVHTPQMRARLSASGLAALLLCTCLELPQTLWNMTQNRVTLMELSCSILLGLIGLVGGITALAAAQDGTPSWVVRSSENP